MVKVLFISSFLKVNEGLYSNVGESKRYLRCLSPAAADIYWDSLGCWWTPPELSLPGVARRCRWSHTAAYTGSPAGQGPTETHQTVSTNRFHSALGFTSLQWTSKQVSIPFFPLKTAWMWNLLVFNWNLDVWFKPVLKKTQRAIH